MLGYVFEIPHEDSNVLSLQVGENQYALVGMPLATSIVPLIQLLKGQES